MEYFLLALLAYIGYVHYVLDERNRKHRMALAKQEGKINTLNSQLAAANHLIREYRQQVTDRDLPKTLRQLHNRNAECAEYREYMGYKQLAEDFMKWRMVDSDPMVTGKAYIITTKEE